MDDITSPAELALDIAWGVAEGVLDAQGAGYAVLTTPPMVEHVLDGLWLVSLACEVGDAGVRSSRRVRRGRGGDRHHPRLGAGRSRLRRRIVIGDPRLERVFLTSATSVEHHRSRECAHKASTEEHTRHSIVVESTMLLGQRSHVRAIAP